MALGFQKYRLSITFVDTGGGKFKRSFIITAPDDTLIRQYCANFVGDMQAVTDLKVQSYEIALVFVESSLTLPTSADGKEVLAISALIAGKSNKRAWLSLPAPKDIVFYAPTGEQANIPNFSNPSLINWIKDFATIANGGYGSASLSDGETITLVDLKGERQHRKG